MALMPTAACAVVLGAKEKQLEVAFGAHMAGNRLGKAGPAGAAFIFVLAGEQRQVAGGAQVGAVALFLVQRAAAWGFGVFLEQHGIGFGRQQIAPVTVRFVERCHAVGNALRKAEGGVSEQGEGWQQGHSLEQ